jgi:anti-sigma factor RsiW
MNCRELRERYDYILDTKPPHILTDEMTEHVRSCDACRTYVQEMEEIDAALRSAVDIEIQPWLDARLKAIPVIYAQRTPARGRRVKTQETVIYAIPLVLVALIAFVFVPERQLLMQVITAALTLGTITFQRVRRLLGLL